MLKPGQRIQVPRNGSPRWLREMTPTGEVDGRHGVEAGDVLVTIRPLGKAECVEAGDYLVIQEGRTRLLVMPKAEAELWALEDEASTREQDAIAGELGHALGLCDVNERLPVTPALGLRLAWAASLNERLTKCQAALQQVANLQADPACARCSGSGNDPLGGTCTCRTWVPKPVLPDVHPSDCQWCHGGAEPCPTHAQDWRYWQARWGQAKADELEQLQALLQWSRGSTDPQPKAEGVNPAHLARMIAERDRLRALRERLEADHVLLMRLVSALASHVHYDRRLGGGTLGHGAIVSRAKDLKVGDFVLIEGAIQVPKHLTCGFLEAIEPDPSGEPHLVVYQWRALDGQVFRFRNVLVTAVPAGSVFTTTNPITAIEEFFTVPPDQRPVGINRESQTREAASAENVQAMVFMVLLEAEAESEGHAKRLRQQVELFAERTGQRAFLSDLRQRLARWIPDRRG